MLAEARRRFGPAGIPVPILLGVLPLVSTRHAEFLHNEVPGITIPDEAREAMRAAGERGSEVGIEMADRLLTRDGGRGRRDVHHAELRALRAVRRARPPDPGASPGGGDWRDARSTGRRGSPCCPASCASGSSSSTARWARCSRPTGSPRPTSAASGSATTRATCAATATCCA